MIFFRFHTFQTSSGLTILLKPGPAPSNRKMDQHIPRSAFFPPLRCRMVCFQTVPKQKNKAIVHRRRCFRGLSPPVPPPRGFNMPLLSVFAEAACGDFPNSARPRFFILPSVGWSCNRSFPLSLFPWIQNILQLLLPIEIIVYLHLLCAPRKEEDADHCLCSAHFFSRFISFPFPPAYLSSSCASVFSLVFCCTAGR